MLKSELPELENFPPVAPAENAPFKRILSSNWTKSATLVIVVLLAIFIGLWPLFQVPPAVPSGAPATEFSAERAMQHLKVIAREPHPINSPANAAVEKYLFEQLTALGLKPQVQATLAILTEEGRFQVAGVRNIVARIEGSGSSGAILLAAHYDSVRTGPGAGDCGSCVSTTLETVRALKAGPALKNDVIVLFTDGEENHMRGADAFVQQHPWMNEVKVAFNFEAAGKGGGVFPNFTSDNNAWLIGEFLKVAPQPLAYSAVTGLLGPAGASGDMAQYIKKGSAGIEFGFMDGMQVYHTALDNPQNIDPRSLQHEGGYLLSLARHFGNLTLNTAAEFAGDAIFFNVLPGVVINYPSSWAVPLSLLVTALFLLVLTLGFRQKKLTVGGFLGSIDLFFGYLVAVGVLVSLLWWLIRQVNTDYQVQLNGFTYQNTLFLLAFVSLTVAATASGYNFLRDRMRSHNLAMGALFWWTVLQLLTGLGLPALSYLFTWPLLLALAVQTWLFFRDERKTGNWKHLGVLALEAIPAVILIAPMLFFFNFMVARLEFELAFSLIGVALLFVALLLGLLIPQLEYLAGQRRWFVPVLTAVAAITFMGVAFLTSGFSEQQPRPVHIAYVLDADTNKAQWVSVGEGVNPWTAQFFPAGYSKTEFSTSPVHGLEKKAPAIAGPAPLADLAAPLVTLQKEMVNGNTYTLTLKISSPRHASDAYIKVEAGGEITAATFAGKAVDLGKVLSEGSSSLLLHYLALPAEGADLSLTVKSLEPVKVTVTDYSNGLPAIPGQNITPRPASAMPALVEYMEPTIVSKSFVFAR